MSKIYSQGNEQPFIFDYFDLHPVHMPRFLDIGAYDGLTFSNTRGLYERGWGGILVEPVQKHFEAIGELYSKDQHVTCVRGLLTPEIDGLVDYWETHDAVSTTSQKIYDIWHKAVEYKKSKAAAISVKNFLKRFSGPYHFVDIDTEGTSFDLARSFPFASVNCRLVSVEADYDWQYLDQHMENQGLRYIARVGENYFWGRP